jgi:uncharacterized MAPEG superfamily protein
MKTETLVFLLTCALALVHFFLPSIFLMLKSGFDSLAGARDGLSLEGSVYGQRAERTSNNFKETLAIALGLMILVQVTGKANSTSAMGAWIYLACRVLYIPLYLFGVPFARTLVWAGSIAGLVMIALQML